MGELTRTSSTAAIIRHILDHRYVVYVLFFMILSLLDSCVDWLALCYIYVSVVPSLSKTFIFSLRHRLHDNDRFIATSFCYIVSCVMGKPCCFPVKFHHVQ